jgi:two-component sensor histidine kinase
MRGRKPDLELPARLFAQSQSFLCVLDLPEFRLTYANPTCLRMLGRADAIGMRYADFMPGAAPEYQDHLRAIARTREPVVRRGEPYSFEIDGVLRTYHFDLVAQPLFDAAGGVEAIFIEGYDVTDKIQSEQQLRLFARELDHRANNLLGVIQGIVNLSRGDGVDALRRSIQGRIMALARAHKLLTEARGPAADVGALVDAELQAHLQHDMARVRVAGPPMSLSLGEAQALALSLHELATNALKYGALGAPGGRVTLTWDGGEGGARRLRWEEAGGPPVHEPARKGLGARLLENSLRGVGGRTTLHWRPEGVACDFELPPRRPG